MKKFKNFFIFFIFISILTIFQFFLRRVYTENYFLSFLYTFIFSLVIIVIGLLFVLVVINFINLYNERKIAGSKFKTKLIVAFIIISLLPTLLFFSFSLYITIRSINIWVNEEIKNSLQDSLSIINSFVEKEDPTKKISLDIFYKIKTLKKALKEYGRLAILKKPLKTIIISSFIILTLLIINFSIWFGFSFAKEISLPVKYLLEGTKKISEGDLSYRIPFSKKDEFKTLIDSFNKMTSDLSYHKEELIKTQRIAAWKEIAQKLAHEIKNPLTPIKLSVEKIYKSYNKENYKAILENCTVTILKQIESLEKLVREFYLFAKMPTLILIPININDMLKETINLYSGSEVKIKFIPTNQLPFIRGDYDKLKQVFINLIDNSIQAMNNQGKINITTDFCKDNVKIEIEDTGIGISADIQKLIFQPYFSTKKKGMGLGLVIVKQIIEDHNGTIEVDSKIGEGTKFIIKLPILEKIK